MEHLFKAKFDCKIITPMFIGGADPSEPLEIRPPAIRGLLRWWFRAMKAEENTEGLKENEKRVFGDNSLLSKVSVRRITSNISSGYNLKGTIEYNFDKNTKTLSGKDKGLVFLLFNKIEGKFIKEGSIFTIMFTSEDINALKEAIKSFWLLIHMGGIGARNRRGFGNVVCNSEPDLNGLYSINEFKPKFIFDGESAASLKDFLKEHLTKIISSNASSSYSTLRNGEIHILKDCFTSWREGLNVIGDKYESYRKSKRIPANIFDGPNFGLPVIHKSMKIVGENYERRSSPLIFKIWKTADKERYYAGFIKLNGDFLPSGKFIKKRGDNVINGSARFDKSKLDEFLYLFTNKENFIIG